MNSSPAPLIVSQLDAKSRMRHMAFPLVWRRLVRTSDTVPAVLRGLLRNGRIRVERQLKQKMVFCRHLVGRLQKKRGVMTTKRCDDLMYEHHSKNTCLRQFAEDVAMKLSHGREGEEVEIRLSRVLTLGLITSVALLERSQFGSSNDIRSHLRCCRAEIAVS